MVYGSAPASSRACLTPAIVEPFWPTATYTQRTWRFGSPDSQLARWLMIVSIAIAVLPVCRSPMISWRWPRPIGVIASIALMPVCIGSCTGCRCTTEGACNLQRPQRGALDLAEAVERLAQRADHPAEERVADRDGQHLPGAAHALPLLDAGKLTEDDDTDLAYVQVQRDAPHAVLELKQLVRHGRRQALDSSDAVAALDDRADLFARDTRWLVLFDELRQRVADLIRPDCQLRHLPHSVREYLQAVPLPAECSPQACAGPRPSGWPRSRLLAHPRSGRTYRL